MNEKLTELESDLLERAADNGYMLPPLESNDLVALRVQTRSQLLDELMARLYLDEVECDCSQAEECLKHRLLRQVEKLRQA